MLHFVVQMVMSWSPMTTSEARNAETLTSSLKVKRYTFVILRELNAVRAGG